MTTIRPTDVTCGACGHHQTVQSLMSTSRSGHGDLDGRPNGHARFTITTWTHECGGCHAVAGDLAKLTRRAAELAQTDAYRAERHRPGREELASLFVCDSLIDELEGNLADAAWARLHAAWACDDASQTSDAAVQRTAALALFDRAPTAAGKELERLALTVDIARRAGDRDRAIALALEGGRLADATASSKPNWRGLFHLQHSLASAGDAAAHTWAEVPLPATVPAPAIPDAMELESLDAVRDTAQLSPRLQIGAQRWRLVDELDVVDAESEAAHAFAILDARDTYRARQKLRYPDGAEVEDIGRAHVGGRVRFRIANLTPGQPILILRRTDYVYGDYQLDVRVDGASAGTCDVAGTDRKVRWRNWPFVVPGAVVTSDRVTVELVALTEGRDVNMFRFWFYQADGEARRAPFIALGERPGIRSLFNFRPETARPLCDLVEVLLRGPSSLTRGERELIAAYVSHLNECRYCTGSHSAYAAAHLPGGHAFVDAVKADPASSGAAPKLVALLAIARLVQRSGSQVTQAAIDGARAAGASDVELHDTVLIASAFCMYNRYVDGLRTTPLADPAGYDAMATHIVANGYVGIS